MCQAGMSNGCRAGDNELGHHNCNTADNKPLWYGGKDFDVEHPTCSEMSAFYEATGNTLESNENWLKSGLCPAFWNVMLLRHPVARLMSHLSFLALNFTPRQVF